MKVGTRSVLFGVHQFLWHPITVLIAWYKLYGIPSLKEIVCIFVHDIGYFGQPNMDGKEGEEHPWSGAIIAHKLFDGRVKTSSDFTYKRADYMNLCLFHSRTCAKKYNSQPSRLCWADKLSIVYDPWWFYLARAWLSGEIWEYRKDAIALGGISEDYSYREWFDWARERGMRAAYTQNPAKAYEF
jgi:hypothetical protein